MINVYILTYCQNFEEFYGASLIFETLRVGFPNAKVRVVDNASLPEAQAKIKELSRENECEFCVAAETEIAHHSFIERTIRTKAMSTRDKDPLVFLDPDICLWKNCEDFAFDGLVAGKKIDKVLDNVTKTLTMPRIHTSFLWVQDAMKLVREIMRIKARRFDFLSFQPFSFQLDGVWYRYDTGAGLYAAISEKCSSFDERHLDCYDHLFGGSHLSWLLPFYNDTCREMMTRTHSWAKSGNIKFLKGIWREQDSVFTGGVVDEIAKE